MVPSNLGRLLEVASAANKACAHEKALEQRITGRFYTHEKIGKAMSIDVAGRLCLRDDLKIIDPFCGDGRLICWLLRAMYDQGKIPLCSLRISVWDCDSRAVELARQKILQTLEELDIVVAKVDAQVVDTFSLALSYGDFFDVCITNPPWETLKPDTRELQGLSDEAKKEYVSLLKEQVFRLEKSYPHSVAAKKFSGWGANLARYGIEASVNLVGPGGVFSVVGPASILGDQISAPLRFWLFSQFSIDVIHYYPAEARLFDGVDQSAVYFAGVKEERRREGGDLEIVRHLQKAHVAMVSAFKIPLSYLEENNYAIGFNGSHEIAIAIPHLAGLLKLGDYEGGVMDLFKIGRELDETGISTKLSTRGVHRFIKGRQIARYSGIAGDELFLAGGISPPASSSFSRVIWRDVARQSSVRRMIATIISPGVVTGNSLNVLAPKRMSSEQMLAVLAVFNSIVFESQVRASVSTNHLSAGAMRRIKVPDLSSEVHVEAISMLVERQLRSPSEELVAEIEVAVAKWYGLPAEVYLGLLASFDGNSSGEVLRIREIVESGWGIGYGN